MALDARFYFDLFSAVLLLAVALLGAWLPRYLAQRSENGLPISKYSYTSSSKMYHLGNCLSGGVMLSAGFCHLLAEALPTLGFVGRFPMATFLAALGLLLTLAADQVVHIVTDTAAHGRQRGTMELTHTENANKEGLAFGDKQEGSSKTGSASHLKLHMHGAEQQCRAHNCWSHGSNSTDPKEAQCRTENMPMLHEAHPTSQLNGTSQYALVAQHKSRRAGLGVPATVPAAVHDCSSGPHIDVLFGEKGKQLSFATTVLLAGALCVHSVLEGMALGAQTTMADTEDIMIAIAAHKGLAAYALGASIVESRASAARFWSVIFAFSSASPIGIFVGYALSSVSNSKGGAALSALASGTFLYVAMMEVIPKELGDPHMRLIKMLAICIGFGLMSLLAIWA